MTSKRIILCDDEPHVITPLAIKLRKAGYDVVTTSDGEEAWQEIEKQLPRLLISDILMPGLDGFGLVERIRQYDVTADLPIVFLTATEIDEKIEQFACDLNVAEVVPKPYSPKEMLAIVKQLVSLEDAESAALAL